MFLVWALFPDGWGLTPTAEPWQRSLWACLTDPGGASRARVFYRDCGYGAALPHHLGPDRRYGAWWQGVEACRHAAYAAVSCGRFPARATPAAARRASIQQCPERWFVRAWQRAH